MKTFTIPMDPFRNSFRMIRLEAGGFDKFIRLVPADRFDHLLDKPKYAEDVFAAGAYFFGHLEAPDHCWCLN